MGQVEISSVEWVRMPYMNDTNINGRAAESSRIVQVGPFMRQKLHRNLNKGRFNIKNC